jgi:hypothetical protein
MNNAITTAAALAAVAAISACHNANDGANAANAAAPHSATAANMAAAPATKAKAGEGEVEVRAFLNGIYAPYATAGGKGADYDAVLEPKLAAAIRAEEGGPGADPFIDAQDWSPFRPTFENIQVKGDRATATATFSNGGTTTRIDYDLIRMPAGWRAYDVKSKDGGSLRARFIHAAG